jgi:C4-dicarboxylate-specific signal transduction histidine kinase
MATATNNQIDTLSSRHYGRYALITLLMVGAMLAWQAWISTRNFRDYHQQLAETSVTGAAEELELLISELQRSMRLFADDQRELLEAVANDTDDDVAWARLENAVNTHFPEYFGLTLTDTAGNVFRPDFDNAVNELCQQDINTFIDVGYSHAGYIHPNPLGYHFDVLVPWGDEDNLQGVFFLSFPPELLARILQRIQAPGHELLLLRTDRKGLIEATARGARTELQREFTLNSDEIERTLISRAINNSRWELVDLPDAQLFRNELIRNAGYALIVFCAFAAVGLLMLQQLRRKEKRRLQAEVRALRHQADLAHVDRLNSMGVMASGLAHELNQPLSAISTYCQAGLRIIETLEDKPDKLVHALEHASIQSQRAGQIIRRMRRFAGKDTVRRQPIDINKLIKNALGLIANELKRKKIKLTLDLAVELPAAIADEIQIEQVILNLLQNAIDAMISGSDNLRMLRITSRRTATDTLQVTVNDSGPGLDAATVENIFDTFFTTRKHGMGLGLAISRSIIEAHGGKLWADPSMGNGATFHFTLSAADA